MEVWSRDVVPGETGRDANFERRSVVCEVGDNHFHNLGRKPA